MSRTWRPDRIALVDAVGTIIVTLLAAEAFSSSYGGVRYLVVAAVGVLLGVAVAHAAWVLRPPMLVSAAGALIVYVVVGGVVALPDRALAGALPSVDTIRGAAEGAVRGWRELLTTAPPVAGIGRLMVLPFVSAYVAGLLTFSLIRRTMRPAAALAGLLPVGVLLGVAILTGVREPASLVLQGPLLAAAVIGWFALRGGLAVERLPGAAAPWARGARAVGMLAVAGVFGWVVAPNLPLAAADERVVWRETITPPFDPRVHPSPLSGYRQYLATELQRQRVLFTIEGVPEDTLVRLATLDTYDGLVWRPGYDEESPSPADSGYFARVGSKIAPEFDGERRQIIVTVGDYTDIWVPDVGEVVSLRFEGGPRDRELNEALRYNLVTDTAVVEIGLRPGDRYVMTVVLPQAPVELAAKPIDFERSLPEAAELQNVVAWTQKVPGLTGVDDPGRRLDAVARHMRQQGAYSDGDRSRGQQPARAGHSAYRLAQFVEGENGLIGNGEQFASTFALIARNVFDIPARVVMGFRTENRSGDVVTVTGNDVDAWVEVPVAGVGWVPVQPTPERTDTALKQQSETPPKPDYDTQSPEPPPLVEPNFDIPATSKSGRADEPDEDDAVEETAEDESSDGVLSGVSPWVFVGLAVAGTPLTLFVLLAAFVVAIKAWRRRRRRRRGTHDERIANGWHEVVDRSIDMGRPVPPTATRREAAMAAGPLTVPLARRADEAVFGPTALTDAEVEAYWAELEQALQGMRSELSIGDRIRAALNVSTIKRRRTTRSPEDRDGRRRRRRRAG